MALKGTLKDFGIADILQLIGQQQKTGILYLKSKKKEVHVTFHEGAIVSVSPAKRKARELIGELLVRAELVDKQQIERALEIQRRTLKRLGEVLLEQNLVTKERFEQVVQLQATETLFELFSWKSGTYEFEQRSVETDSDAMMPMYPEAVLMEAFRRLDEWPGIRKLIPSTDLVFERVTAEPDSEDREIGQSERTVFALVNPTRDVKKLCEVSCLGEFETRHALAKLLRKGYVRSAKPKERAKSARPRFRFSSEEAIRSLARAVVSVAIIAGLVVVVSQVRLPRVGLSTSPTSAVADRAIERWIANSQLGRIEAALEVYRAMKGQFPETLDSLVEVGLLGEGDLSYPWHETYYYRRVSGREFILLPPLK